MNTNIRSLIINNNYKLFNILNTFNKYNILENKNNSRLLTPHQNKHLIYKIKTSKLIHFTNIKKINVLDKIINFRECNKVFIDNCDSSFFNLYFNHFLFPNLNSIYINQPLNDDILFKLIYISDKKLHFLKYNIYIVEQNDILEHNNNIIYVNNCFYNDALKKYFKYI